MTDTQNTHGKSEEHQGQGKTNEHKKDVLKKADSWSKEGEKILTEALGSETITQEEHDMFSGMINQVKTAIEAKSSSLA